jgi:hypothetical protein
VAGSGPARAQDCRVAYEEMARLKSSATGSYNLWDTVHGDLDRDEAYKSALTVPGGDLIVAGESVLPGSGPPRLTLSRVGRNGRVVWEVFHAISGLESVVKIVPQAQGFAVVANRKDEKGRSVVWIGFVNPLGAVLKSVDIAQKGADLQVYDIAASPGGKGYLLATEVHFSTQEQPVSATLYTLDAEGKVKGDRTLVTGTENRIAGLAYLDDGTVLGTGYSYGEDGRKNGWIVHLNADLSIDWQQVYPRGMGAELKAGRVLLKDYIAVTGTAAPIVQDGMRAGWVMVVNRGNGAVGWQRYYTSDQHYAGVDLLTGADGTISVMLDGALAPATATPEHIRILTLNPRGATLASESYMNAELVDAYQMLEGPNRERVIVGRSQVAHQTEVPNAKTPEEAIKTVRSYEGWIAAVPGAVEFKDPCRQSYNPLP